MRDLKKNWSIHRCLQKINTKPGDGRYISISGIVLSSSCAAVTSFSEAWFRFEWRYPSFMLHLILALLFGFSPRPRGHLLSEFRAGGPETLGLDGLLNLQIKTHCYWTLKNYPASTIYYGCKTKVTLDRKYYWSHTSLWSIKWEIWLTTGKN